MADQLGDAVISSVNWAEVVQKIVSHGWPRTAVSGVRTLGVRVLPFTQVDAERSAWARIDVGVPVKLIR